MSQVSTAVPYAQAQPIATGAAGATAVPVSSANPLPVGLPSSVATSWDGSAIDMRAYGTVSIWCTVAPTAAVTVEVSVDGNAPWVAAGFNNAALTISATSRNNIQGACFARIAALNSGTFLIGAGS